MEPQLNPEEAAPELAQPSASSDTNGGEKLPMSIKLAYGMPNLAGAGMAIPIAIHMNIFYSDVVLVPLGYIALAVALARSFDAITDPLMGWISDRTNTRWGRRRPWMLLGAPLAAVAFVLLFSPPESDREDADQLRGRRAPDQVWCPLREPGLAGRFADRDRHRGSPA